MCVEFTWYVGVYIFLSSVCREERRTKEREGKHPETHNKEGETPQNAAQAPTPFTDKKPIQSPFE